MIRQYLGFENGFGADSVGTKGELVLLWKADWKVVLKSFGSSHIDTFVTDPNGLSWRFTGFYGHPNRQLDINHGISFEDFIICTLYRG